jgi:Peptidase family M1 domain
MALAIVFVTSKAWTQSNVREDKFKQLGPELATPNAYRTASGAPGHAYWQQKADYQIAIQLDDENQMIKGDETVTYTNQSPDVLTYIWLQLDQNIYAENADAIAIEQSKIGESMSYNDLVDLNPWFDGGFKLDLVQDSKGQNLPYTINQTMMRIDLPQPLKPGATFSFRIKWWYNINDRMRLGGRSGYEYFEADGNYLYTIAQFYPRMVVYSDNQGWQHKQFLGAGEFTLNFGNYKVSLTVPDDHIVASTGVLQNPSQVLTSDQFKRYEKAKSSAEPVVIVTQDEAIANEKDKAKSTKTWVFHAENVRDFAFATSRKFIWDAQAVEVGSKKPMAMSFYPKEGNPLWGQLSTRMVAHTLRTYSKYTVDYPYPVAISVHAKWIGMEYPMICFNGGRPEPDGTYDEGTRNGMISVIIHEVGHNFFPMIINSDERQWTWMDEGLNTFVQYLTEKEYDRNYPTRRGPARNIVDYMKGDKTKMSPIMTNSESVYQFGNNAYGKPATALNVLRETVMGRELFDYAFKEYCRRWAFKHPTPDDFYRTMEDASGVDLDWFWRGWFYGVDHCDMALETVKLFRLNTHDPLVEKQLDSQKKLGAPADISIQRDIEEKLPVQVDLDPDVRDFYTEYDPFKPTQTDTKEYEAYLKNLSEEEKKLIKNSAYYYELTFKNAGGLVMPLIVQFNFTDGSNKLVRIPAEIWKMSELTVTKVFSVEKPVASIDLDPFLETADVELSNNTWPVKVQPTRFELFKQQQQNWKQENPMQKAQKEKGNN